MCGDLTHSMDPWAHNWKAHTTEDCCRQIKGWGQSISSQLLKNYWNTSAPVTDGDITALLGMHCFCFPIDYLWYWRILPTGSTCLWLWWDQPHGITVVGFLLSLRKTILVFAVEREIQGEGYGNHVFNANIPTSRGKRYFRSSEYGSTAPFLDSKELPLLYHWFVIYFWFILKSKSNLEPADCKPFDA